MMLYLLLLNLTLTGLWLVLNEQASFLQLLLGFVVGALITHLVGIGVGTRGYLPAVWSRIRFLGYFLYILVKANLEVAREIITPGLSMKPRLIRYDVSDLSPVQVTTLASAITLTPGTLSADIADDGETLYIHAMYAYDRDAAVKQLDELRDRLMEVFKP